MYFSNITPLEIKKNEGATKEERILENLGKASHAPWKSYRYSRFSNLMAHYCCPGSKRSILCLVLIPGAMGARAKHSGNPWQKRWKCSLLQLRIGICFYLSRLALLLLRAFCLHLSKIVTMSTKQVETNHRNQGQTSAPRHAKISLMLTIPGWN